jgi:hypothetical protein
MRKPRPKPTRDDLAEIALAIQLLRHTRDKLRRAGAVRAANYVARALKSAEGAARHAARLAGSSKEGLQ